MGVEAADYVRSILVEMTNPGVKVRNLEKEFVKRPLLAFTDAKRFGGNGHKRCWTAL